MNYKATFEIDGGVSNGFGLKQPDNTHRTEYISSPNPQDAYIKTMELATDHANNYLSNPETGYTTVKLVSLVGPEGNIPFDPFKSTVRRSMFQHMIAVISEMERG